MLLVVLLAGCAGEQRTEIHSWDGTWRSFWRDGQALMTLEEAEDQVSGTYWPGDGQVEGTRQGDRLVGQWFEEGRQGEFVFALSPDGNSFVGRFANEEYWNGERIDSASYRPVPFREASTPAETLRSLVTALNAIADENVAASILLPSLVVYADSETSPYQKSQRRQLLKQIIDLTTFRIWEAPEEGQDGRAAFVLRTQNSEWSYPLQFVETEPDQWRVLVPEADSLRQSLREGLRALGFETYGTYAEAARNSPRGTMRQFLTGVANWNTGGQGEVLASMDLSSISAQLRAIEGPLVADYLRQVIDRVGYVIWQEIPNDSDGHQPYVHYENAGGRIVIVPPSMSGADRWLFSAETVRDAASIYDDIQALPVAAGTAPSPLTDFFQVRRAIRSVSPVLLERSLWLDNWQWLGLLATLLVAGLLAFLGGRVAAVFKRWALTRIRDDEDDGGTPTTSLRVAWPVRLAIVGLVVLYCLRLLGLRQDLATVLGTTASLLIVGGVTALLVALVTVFGNLLSRQSRINLRYVDDIVISLAVGITKIVLVIAGIFVAADVVGLPYEGVVAGLGVGGLALAIAARDTVSNFISAGILLADRPFNRGDLIDVEGALATVQSVGMRSTRLRTQDDSLLIVPNHKLTDSMVNNFGKRRHRRIVLLIGLTYDTPRERVDAFVSGLRETFKEQPLAGVDLYIGLHEFSDSAYTIRLWGYFQTNQLESYVEAQHQLMGDIIELAEAVDVEFAFPTRTLHIATGPANGRAPTEMMESSSANP